ncbi:MAG: DNA mismatch repair protein MutL [candidate division GAL15 bacterium]
MPRIRVLDSLLADRIAAGEVVERPASVVKELVENALDAGARSVTVEFSGGGFELIRVRDDGEGMDPEDARLCLRRFATSKLSGPEDLRCIRTLGFRGEALPAIAAVSQLEILTCDGQRATRVRTEGGAEVRVEPASAPRGTVVTVRRLFYNTPARRRFLRSVAREAALCLDAVERQALARHEVSFRVVRDGREVAVWPAEDMACRAARILGVVTEDLLTKEVHTGGVHVRAFLAPPAAARRSRSGQYFLINRRPVTSALLSRAVEQGTRTLVFTGYHPVCAVYVELLPERVDPNVHPRKLEVRFSDESRVFAAVEQAVREAYRSRSLVRTVPLVAAPAAAPLRWEVREASPTSLLTPQVRSGLPELRLLAQLGNTYVLAESPEGLVVLDQHAAHERVLYERLMRQRLSGVHAQVLATPVVVDLSPAEAAVVPELQDVLREVGIEVEPFGPDAVLVRSVPAISGKLHPESLLRACLLEGIRDGVATVGQRALERVASVVACHSAVRAGDPLSAEELAALVEELRRCEDPYTCFHGRPTLVVLPLDRLQAWFLRR